VIDNPKVGLVCFYQGPDDLYPEYFKIASYSDFFIKSDEKWYPIEHCYWPPSYNSMLGCNPDGQIYSNPEDLPPIGKRS
jgi:hypothetical protein